MCGLCYRGGGVASWFLKYAKASAAGHLCCSDLMEISRRLPWKSVEKKKFIQSLNRKTQEEEEGRKTERVVTHIWRTLNAWSGSCGSLIVLPMFLWSYIILLYLAIIHQSVARVKFCSSVARDSCSCLTSTIDVWRFLCFRAWPESVCLWLYLSPSRIFLSISLAGEILTMSRVDFCFIKVYLAPNLILKKIALTLGVPDICR